MCARGASSVVSLSGARVSMESTLTGLAERLKTNAGKLERPVHFYALAEAGRARGGSLVAARGLLWSAERGEMP